MSQETDEVIANYWVEHYMNHKLCSLCGNCGVIDTRKTAKTAVGHNPGRLNYCICPNGQAARVEAIELGQKLAPIKGEEYDWALMPRLKRRREEIMLQIRSLNRKGKNKWRINPSQ